MLSYSLRNFCKIPEERIKEETARFEDMILTEGARLKQEGKRGLIKLPGVDQVLSSVSRTRTEGGFDIQLIWCAACRSCRPSPGLS